MKKKIKLGILTSHPIQYQVPLFRELAKTYELIVYYMQDVTPEQQAKAGFGINFSWDTDLFSGYNYEYLENKASDPNVISFWGCNTPSIFKKVKQKKYDVFIVMGWYLYSYLQGILASRVNKVPLLVRGDSHLNTQRNVLKRLIKVIPYRFLMSHFSGFLIVGKYAKEYFEYYGASRSKIFNVPHFVDNQYFAIKSGEAITQINDIKRTLQINPNNRILLFVGKFVTIKRPIDVLQAAKLIMKNGINCTCLFVGAGDLEKHILSYAMNYGIDIRIVGFKNQSELPMYYAMADLLILPSESETWGLVVNEALACGLRVVVSSKVGCAPDLIIDNVTGIVYEKGDIKKLADAIEKLLYIKVDSTIKKQIKDKISEYSISKAIEGIDKAIDYVTK
jgi:glycosyltransferase involved in cell wall biosynthesis